MQTVELKITLRKEGKSGARQARTNGLIPAILYGRNYEPTTITINDREFKGVTSTQSGMNVLLNLVGDDGKKVVARVREYQAHPISREFTHVDFQAVDLTKKISVEVPVHLEGKAKGVKEGGVLVIDRRSLVVKCLPTAIPNNIVVDISGLAIGQGVHINDLKLPEGVECPHEINFGIVSVVTPMKEEVAAPAAEAVPAEGAAAVVPGAPAAGAAPGAATGSAAVSATGAAKASPGAAPAAGAAAKPAAGAPKK